MRESLRQESNKASIMYVLIAADLKGHQTILMPMQKCVLQVASTHFKRGSV